MSWTRKKRSQKSNKKQNEAEDQPLAEEISEYEVSEHEEETTVKKWTARRR